jgi:low affinity Fe/Cu permease
VKKKFDRIADETERLASSELSVWICLAAVPLWFACAVSYPEATSATHDILNMLLLLLLLRSQYKNTVAMQAKLDEMLGAQAKSFALEAEDAERAEKVLTEITERDTVCK